VADRKIDILLLIFFPIFSVVASVAFEANYLVSTLLFFGLPGLYLSFRNHKTILKSFIFSILLGFPFAIIVDSVALLSKSWVTYSMFDFRFLGLIPIEDFLFGTLFVYTTIMFYEHLLDKGKDNKIDRRLRLFIIPLTIVFLLFLIILFRNSELLDIPYAYFWIGLLAGFLPLAAFLSFFPRLFCKFIKSASYFFFLTLLFELTALHLNQWAFPGDKFLFWVNIYSYHFPFEELFFWVILAAVSVLTYYEFFADDRK